MIKVSIWLEGGNYVGDMYDGTSHMLRVSTSSLEATSKVLTKLTQQHLHMQQVQAVMFVKNEVKQEYNA